MQFIDRGLLLLAAALTCLACASSRDEPAASPVSIRLASYNVKHGLGMDGQLDLDRIANVLRELDADFILLQEIDERCGRSGGVDQAAALGERLAMESRFAPFMDFDGGRYGLAILSRPKVAEAEVVVLPPGKQEPRSALVITARVGDRLVRVANAHFDWLADDAERLEQARVLDRAMTADASAPPIVFGGDLNDVPGSRTLELFVRQRGPSSIGFERLGPEGGTFPSDGPVKTIDHVLAAPVGAWDAGTVRVVEERIASDHRPIVVDLVLR